jgi:hypothetical protein
MITIQNNAETQPVIAYRTILYKIRRTKDSGKRRTNIASAVLGGLFDVALVFLVASPDSGSIPPWSVAL